jgi:hypothetical protein
VLQTLHAVPQPGAAVTARGYVWTVVDKEGARIAKVKSKSVRASREP